MGVESTRATLNDHLKAFGRLDLDGIVETYSEDGVLINEHDVLTGREEIRSEFQRLFRIFENVDMTIEENLDEAIVVDDFGYIVWHAETEERRYDYVTATFYVPEDTIRVQTMAARVLPT